MRPARDARLPRLAPVGDWLETDDIGSEDASGSFVLAGRSRDVIRTGGESVFASDVETALDADPDVAESAVVGVPHALLGEAVAPAIVVRPSGKPPVGLAEWCRARLSWIFQVDGLPTNALGSVVKQRLKMLLEHGLSVHGKEGTVVRAKP